MMILSVVLSAPVSIFNPKTLPGTHLPLPLGVLYLNQNIPLLISYNILTFFVVVVVVFTLKTVLTSIQYPSLSYSSRQRNEFPSSQANPK